MSNSKGQRQGRQHDSAYNIMIHEGQQPAEQQRETENDNEIPTVSQAQPSDHQHHGVSEQLDGLIALLTNQVNLTAESLKNASSQPAALDFINLVYAIQGQTQSTMEAAQGLWKHK